MKLLRFLIIFLTSIQALAQDSIVHSPVVQNSMIKGSVIKTCHASIIDFQNPDEYREYTFTILQTNKDTYAARVTTHQTAPYFNQVQIKHENVRENIEPSQQDLNFTEKLILHAQLSVKENALNTTLTESFKLDQIRSATLYIIGALLKLDTMTLLEAYDKDENYLGTFVAGITVALCEQLTT